jgi:sec-independent protein translocase protein TatA
MTMLAFIFGLGAFEVVLIGAIAVMLYGKRLPEVGRSVGHSIGEMRRQFNTLAKEMDLSATIASADQPSSKSRGRIGHDDELGPAGGSTTFDPPA